MKIPKPTVNKWKLEYEFGDIEKIYRATLKAGNKISRNSISNALTGNNSSLKTITAINQYYLDKKNKEKVLLNVLEAE
jgi:hypothetical protein